MTYHQSADAARVLVVGAREGSLGHHVAAELHNAGAAVHTAGIGNEALKLNASFAHDARRVYEEVRPTHVVCTVGANIGGPVYGQSFIDDAFDSMLFNYFYPMNLLTWYMEWLCGMPGTFVAVSSNSAHIARSNSGSYCASKAALSMGLRCAARDVSRAGLPVSIWGYEPGALADTPMTQAVQQRIGKETPMSRMLTHPAGLNTKMVANIIARDTIRHASVLHGSLVRLDNGDQ
jgi:NAD(P)-dependent dehydrogenase (short-subunit alcohol dehydrogenase family)